MKIDVHTHTKKCKTGDAHTREIAAMDFCETIRSTEVKIVAITNHNVFDLTQYEEIIAKIGTDAQIWPGIELDVVEDGSRGHLLVIVSPALAKGFLEAVELVTEGSTPDNFVATIDHVVESFDGLSPLYVAHYKQKKPNLSDEAIEKLQSKTSNPDCVIKEVTNAISAGIYISHGHASIYGSDVHDWAKYKEQSHDLPDLRLPVDSFEHFCLLLKKDPTAINTVLDRKTPEDLVLSPFDDQSTLNIRAYNDINVVFGPKGTGKSRILKAIAKHYSENGVDARVYESVSDGLDEIFDLKGKDLTINLNTYGINYCTDEIKALRDASEVEVTSVRKYYAHYAAENTNRNAKKLLLKDIDLEDASSARREFTDFHDASATTSAFLTFLSESLSVEEVLNEQEATEIIRNVKVLLERLAQRKSSGFSEWKEISLLNQAIEIFRREVERKTGTPARPTKTGFRDYAMNRLQIEVNAATVLRGVDTLLPLQDEIVGSLDSDKGVLHCHTEFRFQSGEVADSSLSRLMGVNKTPQKKFVKAIRKILRNAYDDNLFQSITELNEIEDAEDIKTVGELLLFKKYFALDGQAYEPSTGEASMVMLQKELETDKEVYILDEPERSLGNEYINDVIVPLIKERARAGKKVFISTHDANIAVRTLPYSSVYRCHGQDGYATYRGNAFSNDLVSSDAQPVRLDWRMISMKTLEGGKEAFGERGKIYGNY